jgi:large subunit ribosomal protein L23
MSMLIKPIISEKSLGNIENNKFTFKVHRSANKPEIAKKIEEIYKVKVLAVNIINKQAELRQTRQRNKYLTKEWKKAIVTLKKGDKIPGFEIKE